MDYGDEWGRKGATLSDKTARAEFGLTQEEIYDAMPSSIRLAPNAEGFRPQKTTGGAVAEHIQGEHMLPEAARLSCGPAAGARAGGGFGAPGGCVWAGGARRGRAGG